MKKAEAQILAPEKSQILIGYLNNILSEDKKLSGKIIIRSVKLDGVSTIVYDISVPEIDLEKHITSEITTDHIDVLTEQILNDLLDTYLEDENLGVSRYFSIRSQMENFNGVYAINNLAGTKITINFVCRGEQFDELINQYSRRIDEYVKRESSPHL